MAGPETRAGCEIRVSGRTLAGPVMRYGEVASDRRERFEAGAFAPVPDVPLNLQHDRSTVVLEAGDFELTDSPAALEIRAVLPESSAALSLVKRGALSGFSIEFHAQRERRESGLRVIDAAQLVGIALVDVPSYPGSRAELRRRGDRGGRLATFRGRVPTGKRLDCRCSPGDCLEALFEDGAFDNLTASQVTEMGRDVLGVVGDYSQAIASRKRKSIRFWQGRDGELEFAIDVPNTERGKALMETFDAVDVLARPVIDNAGSRFTRDGTLARYSQARVRALTIGPTDAAAGWTPLQLRRDANDDMPEEPARPARRRARRWL